MQTLLRCAAIVFLFHAGTTLAAERWIEVAAPPAIAKGAFVPGTSTQPSITVSAVVLSDNADDDGWADTAETVAMRIALFNPTDADITGVRLRLTSDDPDVGCLVHSEVTVAVVAAGATVVSAPFQWIVAPGVGRSEAFEELTAEFALHVDADGFAGPQLPQPIVVDLDLNATGGGAPTTWFESFESGFGSFTTMHIDEPLNPPNSDLSNRPAGVINADGYRCPYSDPEWFASATYGNGGGERCFPNPPGQPDAFYFRVVGDRAFSGVQSLAWNVFLSEAEGYTTPTAQLEAVRTIDPVHLGWSRICSTTRSQACGSSFECPIGETCVLPSPKLSFKQQVSQMDHRSINAEDGRAADRGVVAIQLAGDDDSAQGAWMKAYPYVNIYDSQASSNFFSCGFDPIDDGNDEGDFFDPTNPFRSQGPSSTCAPEYSFSHQGDTDAPFDPVELGDAIGPGLAGATGIGTWVEPIVDLSRFRGRHIRLRFLMSGLARTHVTWQQAFANNPDPGDDGWFIDDVAVSDAVATPASLVPDPEPNVGLAECGDFFCGQSGGVEIAVEMVPDGPTSAPGRPVRIDTAESTVDVCLDGALQRRFWIDVDGNGSYSEGTDVLLRDWDYTPEFVDQPIGRTTYGVDVRCETAEACAQTEIVVAEVGCSGPGDGETGHGNPFLHSAAPERRTVRVAGDMSGGEKQAVLLWTTGAMVDIVRGDLGMLRSEGGFGSTEVCAADNVTAATSMADAASTPSPGDAVFWVLRSAEECNDSGAGGSYGLVGETGTRDTIAACPD